MCWERELVVMIAIPGHPYPVIACFCFRISKELMKKPNHYHQAPNCKYNTHIPKFLYLWYHMCICVCKKYAASTISGLPFCTSCVRPIEKHLGGVLPLRSHLFPYSIAPCARAAAFVVSMLLRGAPQVFSQQSTCVFQVIELSVAIDPYNMAPLQSFLVITNFNTTLSDVRVFWYQFDGVDTSDL